MSYSFGSLSSFPCDNGLISFWSNLQICSIIFTYCYAFANARIVLRWTLTSFRDRCVLELCCTTTSAIGALLRFSNLASQHDKTAYSTARVLFSHEWSQRLSSKSAVKDDTSISPSTHAADKMPKAQIEHIRELMGAFFLVSERSFSGFWMRAIGICALRLDVSICLLCSSLNHSLQASTAGSNGENLLRLAMDRSLERQKDCQMPEFEENIRIESFRACLSSLSALLGEKSLPRLYQSIIRDIMYSTS